MATITPVDRNLRPELSRLLGQLRSRIRRYIVLEGVALLVAVAAGLFWLLLGLDQGYFALTQFELPVALRVGLMVLAVGLVAGIAVGYVVLRIARKLRARALALVLERRFPELDDRLILAVERAEGVMAESPGSLGDFMLTRAIDDVSTAVERLDVSDVFDRTPLRRAILAAVVLAVPILILAVGAPSLLAGWRDGFLRFEESYHPRDTLLALTILAPPDERPRRLEVGGTYLHPRGAGLVVQLDVPEEKRADGKSWLVPETAYAVRRTVSGARQTIPSIRTKTRQFRLTIEDVTESMELWVRGGDFATPVPYRIEVVDPPRVERVELTNYYPLHTRQNERTENGGILADRRALLGPVLSVPVGTWTAFQAQTNKPVFNARIFLGESELAIGRFLSGNGEERRVEATLITPNGEEEAGRRVTLPSRLVETMIASDGRSVTVPLLVGGDAVEFLPNGPAGRTDVPTGRPVFVVPAQLPVRVVFEDQDQVVSLEPSRFEVRGVVDEAPRVRTTLRGVSNIITRNAVIPVQGTIEDDFGIVSARFDYRIDDAEGWSMRPLANPPRGEPREFVLKRDEANEVEWLDTATLNLQLGQQLRLAVTAVDGDNLSGPHIARGDEYQFTIVTAEELLATLYNQEINLRKRFEQSLSEMQAVRDDLVRQRDREPGAEEGAEGGTSLRSSADRAFAETQQHTGEVRSVESAFSEILEQFVNNRVHTESQLERIRTGIIQPLQRLTREDFPRVDQAVADLRLRIAERDNPEAGLEPSIVALERLIATMRAALAEMQDLAEFHEAIQDLTQILELEGELLDRTREEQKRSVIEGLGDLLD